MKSQGKSKLSIRQISRGGQLTNLSCRMRVCVGELFIQSSDRGGTRLFPNLQHFLMALIIMYQPPITNNPALKIVKAHRATADQNENYARRDAMTVP